MKTKPQAPSYTVPLAITLFCGSFLLLAAGNSSPVITIILSVTTGYCTGRLIQSLAE
jgi:uncharacterized membrane protein YjjP (DUF1212 family)